VKKAGVLKMQLDAYKRQVQDLQLKSTDATSRADKAEFDAKRHQEKAAVLALDKEVMLYINININLILMSKTTVSMNSSWSMEFISKHRISKIQHCKANLCPWLMA